MTSSIDDDDDVELGVAAAAAAVPPPVPFVLSFTDLSYTVKTSSSFLSCCRLPSRRLAAAGEDQPGAAPAAPRGRTKTLLDGISGEARNGEIFAVLGASGSGKSTLIDALANRIAGDSLRGATALNGEPVSGAMLKAISAYVMQDDLLYPMLTVRETLLFAADFRLPRSLSPEKKRARVDALIDQLGLAAAAGTIIGDETHRGVSGGERRRVSIGTDIIHDPILLFLDEPTSGLDSTSAFNVVQVLRRIAESGSIVFMSIHQPSYRILELIDRLLFLSRGRTVFSGSPASLAPFFADFTGKPVPEKENPVEYALDVIRDLESDPDTAKRSALVAFSTSRTATPPSTKPPALPLAQAVAARLSVTAAQPQYVNPVLAEVVVLTRRSFMNAVRLPELFLMRLATIVVTALIYATIFWKLDESPKGVQERLGFFAIGMATMFYVCADALPVFVQERTIFLRETAHNAYRRASYVLSNAAVAFPPLVLLSLAFAGITYSAVGLAGGAPAFGFFALVVLAAFWAGSGFVTFLSAVVPHVMVGYVVVVAVLSYFLLFSGFFITRDRIPRYWIWFHYLSLVKYPYQAVLQNEFGDGGRCFARGLQIFDGTPVGAMPEAVKARVLEAVGAALGTELTASSCMTTGAEVLAQQGVTDLGKWKCVAVTVAWGFFFRVLFYVALLLGGKNKRK